MSIGLVESVKVIVAEIISDIGGNGPSRLAEPLTEKEETAGIPVGVESGIVAESIIVPGFRTVLTLSICLEI